MPISGYFDIPFAEDGDLTAVPDAAQTNGSVSYTNGFPILYSTAVASGGYNFPRAQFNQIMNDVTSAIQEYQQFTTAPYISSAMNGGSPFPYAKYATLLYTDGHIYQSLTAANTVTPANDGVNWAIVDYSQGIPSRSLLVTTTGTWTCPANVTTVLVDGAAGGGGGSGTNGTTNGGEGGGGGQACIATTLTVVPGTTYTLTIGAAGTGGAASNDGTGGGNTTFGALLTLVGGAQGSKNGIGAGGAGGFGGSSGQDANGLIGGNGGSSIFGAAGMQRQGGGDGASGYGAGGAGGTILSSTASAGGAGAAGFLFIRW